jgi:outer membrane protein OmpA-like peptidoglycan-associated protein
LEKKIMIASLCLFLIGGGAGAFLAARHFLKRGLPGWIAILHGVIGAAGFALLLFFCAREPSFMPARYSLAILAIAIGLGCVNVVYHLRRVRHRTVFIVAHATAALTGVGTVMHGAVVHAHASVASVMSSAKATAAIGGVLNATPASKEPERAKRQVGLEWTDLDIRFDPKSVNPTEESLVGIATIAEQMKSDPDLRLIEVQGHADERGDDGWNMDLTRARAKNVMEMLLAHGIPRSRLRAAGYGARCSADPSCRRADAPKACHDEAAWRRDRRVTLVVVETATDHFRGPIACPGN